MVSTLVISQKVEITDVYAGLGCICSSFRYDKL
jgi:hypothetical protein